MSHLSGSTRPRVWGHAFRMYCLFLLGSMTVAGGILPSAPVEAQTRRWSAHTSMREVLDLSVSEEALWAATTGGVFRYVPETGELQPYTAAEGLHNVQTRAIAYDGKRNVVWIGYRDGVIDRLDVSSGDVRTFFDIQRSDRYPTREINRLYVQGDSLLVATSFGLVIFDPVREEVRDTYSQFATMEPAIPVRDVKIAPIPGGGKGFWLATDEGVAYASLGSINLQDPSSWAAEQEGLPDLATSAIAYFNGRVYVGTTGGLAVRLDDGTYEALSVTDLSVLDLEPLADRLVAADPFKVYGLDGSGTASLLMDGFEQLFAVAVGPDGNLWLGDSQRGLTALAAPDGASRPDVLVTEVYPEGPYDGLFSDLTVDAQGNLWAGATAGASQTGFYRRHPDGTWTSYTGRFFDELQGRSGYSMVHAGHDGSLWAASAGAGLAQVTSDGILRLYDASNSSLRAVESPTFVPVTGVATEVDGTLWVSNREAGTPLHVRTPDGVWTALPPPTGCDGLAIATTLGPVFVDAFGNKWIVVLSSSNFKQTLGLLVLNSGARPDDPSDDVCRFIGQKGGNGQGLPSTSILAVTEDRDGRVWIGTEEGPAYVLSSTLVASNAAAVPIWPQLADRDQGTYVLGGINRMPINDIAVDPSNRVWMATNEGAFLFEDVGDGTFRQVEHVTAEDSPLFSDIVLAVTVDPHTGEVYFATDQGLVSYEGDALAPVAEVQELFVYPNPVRLDDGAVMDIFIQNLVEETDIKIVAPHGAVVAEFSARGGRARWDGRDMNRELVPSGVYLIVAVGKNGEGAAYGKVAVIR